MIAVINASAIAPSEGELSSLSPEQCLQYLVEYRSSKVRLWAYHPSLSRLVFRIAPPSDQGLRPIDLVFVGVFDIHCPVHWVLAEVKICSDPGSPNAVFQVPSANVLISASDLTIVVQDEYPHKIWELEW